MRILFAIPALAVLFGLVVLQRRRRATLASQPA